MQTNPSGSTTYMFMNGSEQSKHERVAKLLYFNFV